MLNPNINKILKHFEKSLKFFDLKNLHLTSTWRRLKMNRFSWLPVSQLSDRLCLFTRFSHPTFWLFSSSIVSYFFAFDLDVNAHSVLTAWLTSTHLSSFVFHLVSLWADSGKSLKCSWHMPQDSLITNGMVPYIPFSGYMLKFAWRCIMIPKMCRVNVHADVWMHFVNFASSRQHIGGQGCVGGW